MEPQNLSLLVWCFRQNFHLDHSNACVHMAPVRYSPITFRLAEAINDLTLVDNEHYQDVWTVILDKGAYQEDRGR